jgi:hypothetical protein
MTRETIYAALFAKVSAISGLVTASRRLRHWSDVKSSEQPALFQIQKTEDPTQKRGLPTVWNLDADLYLYVHSGKDHSAIPSTQLNRFLDAIEAALAPTDPVTNAQTLGGLVSHCWISGRIETDEGVLGDQAVAIIPVAILV